MRLHHAFQDSSHFYLLLSYCGGGDLYAYLTARDKLTEHGAQIILGEVALALQYLHEEHSVVYRDLKPENVLLGLDGHAVLSDFGTAKRLSSSERTQEDGGSRGVPSTQTMIGTAEYMAPEARRRRRRPPARARRRRRRATTPRRPRLTHLPPRPPLHPQVLLGQPYSFAVDWWAAGVLLYEMLTGAPPSEKAFGRMTALEMQMEQLRARRAADGAAAAPATAMSEWWRRDGALPAEVREGAASLISGLLSPDPTARLGGSAAGGVSAIFSHEFFASVDWIALRQVRHRPRARAPQRRRPPARPRARAAPRAPRPAAPRAAAPAPSPLTPLLLPSARAAVTPRDRPPRARPPPGSLIGTRTGGDTSTLRAAAAAFPSYNNSLHGASTDGGLGAALSGLALGGTALSGLPAAKDAAAPTQSAAGPSRDASEIAQAGTTVAGTVRSSNSVEAGSSEFTTGARRAPPPAPAPRPPHPRAPRPPRPHPSPPPPPPGTSASSSSRTSSRARKAAARAQELVFEVTAEGRLWRVSPALARILAADGSPVRARPARPPARPRRPRPPARPPPPPPTAPPSPPSPFPLPPQGSLVGRDLLAAEPEGLVLKSYHSSFTAALRALVDSAESRRAEQSAAAGGAAAGGDAPRPSTSDDSTSSGNTKVGSDGGTAAAAAAEVEEEVGVAAAGGERLLLECTLSAVQSQMPSSPLLGGWRLPGTDNQPEGAVSHTLVRLSVRRIRLLNAVVSMSTVQGRKGSNSGLPAPAPAPPPSYLQVPLDGKPSPGSSRQFGPPVPSAMSPPPRAALMRCSRRQRKASSSVQRASASSAAAAARMATSPPVSGAALLARRAAPAPTAAAR